MSSHPQQDVQLARSAGNGHPAVPAAVGIDPLGQGIMPTGGAAARPGGGGDATPLKKVHRLLRGRYPYVIGSCAVVAALGALVGWLSQVRTYTSVGQIEVTPVLFSFDDVDKVMPFAGQFVAKQVQLLQHPRVLEAAVSRDEWRRHRPDLDLRERVADFVPNLEVARVRDTFIVMVSFTDPDPQVASDAVASVIRSFMTLYGESALSGIDTKLELLRKNELELTGRINGLRAQQEQLEQTNGLEQVTILINSKTPDLPQLERAVREAEMLLSRAQEATKAGPTDDGNPDQPRAITPEMIANIAAADPEMQKLMDERSLAQRQVTRLLWDYGENHRAVTAARREVELHDRMIREYAVDFFRHNKGIQFSADGTGSVPLTEAQLAQMAGSVEQLRRNRQQLNDEIGALTRHKSELLAVARNIQTAEAERVDVQRDIQQFATQQQMSGRISSLSEGSIPVTPSRDNRTKVAFLGLLAGAGLPLAGWMLAGLVQSRYRYSDEATDDLAGTPLLGILPELPDRLSDPEQASVAAHCVHQIRTMLQISAGGPGQQAYAVTSAGPGDGKTSLTLALGLSYAACGSRVLLVDCDLVGGGLTARLNVSAAEGVLEAIANRALLEYVRNTDIADVAILPVGAKSEHHASTLSPQALRRLIADARRQFDVILIDTGPVLSSIEASLVCAATDGVVLTVKRGRERTLVERSLGHLKGIGARVVGVVFNRADTDDFANSLSGMSVSLRSQRRQSGGQFGPVARAVATAEKPATNGG